MKLILPKIVAPEDGYPIFFLLGPVLGGDDWQSQVAMELSTQLGKPFYVAIPISYEPSHILYEQSVPGGP